VRHRTQQYRAGKDRQFAIMFAMVDTHGRRPKALANDYLRMRDGKFVTLANGCGASRGLPRTLVTGMVNPELARRNAARDKARNGHGVKRRLVFSALLCPPQGGQEERRAQLLRTK
jgi:hypothetical protein